MTVDVAQPSLLDLSALLQWAPDPCLVVDPEFTIAAINDAYLRIAGVQREAILGKSIFELFPAEVKDESPLRSSLLRVRQTLASDTMPVQKLSFQGSDGSRASERQWQIVHWPVLTPHGEAAYLVHRLEDVTELTYLRSRQGDACSLDPQHFIRMAAHDLQAPLYAIAGFTQFLQEECAGKLGEQGERYMGLVLDNTRRMQTLVHDLLTYCQADSKPRTLEAVNVDKVLQEVLFALTKAIAEADAKIIASPLPVLRADRAQIAQLLMSLVGNAVKYRRANQSLEIRITAARQDDEWLFSIQDNGIGIDAKYHESIFDIFRRLHSYQTYPGSGIGLALCRLIVTGHGGRIWVESQERQGSTFYFTLPADR